MNTLCVRLLPLILLLLSAGCNSDIFIEDQDRPSVSRIEIPDGGEESVRFATDNLVSVEVFFDGKFDCVKYLPLGDEFASYKGVRDMALYKATSSQPFITRLTARNDEADFEILGDASGRITVKSISNVRGEPVTGRIVIAYSYGREDEVEFSIESSFDEPSVLQAEKLVYTGQILSLPSERETSFTVSNYGASESRQIFEVAKYCRMLVYLQHADWNGLKIDFNDVEAEIPTWDAAKKAPAFLGEKIKLGFRTDVLQAPDNVLPEGKSFTAEYEVVTPAMKSSKATLKWTEMDIWSSAKLVTVNPRNGRVHEIEVRLDVIQPIDYDFSVETTSLDK